MRPAEFAREIGCTPGELHEWEVGNRRPSFQKATTLLKKFPVTADWLYYGDPRNMPFDLAQKLFGQPAGPKAHGRG